MPGYNYKAKYQNLSTLLGASADWRDSGAKTLSEIVALLAVTKKGIQDTLTDVNTELKRVSKSKEVSDPIQDLLKQSSFRSVSKASTGQLIQRIIAITRYSTRAADSFLSIILELRAKLAEVEEERDKLAAELEALIDDLQGVIPSMHEALGTPSEVAFTEVPDTHETN